MQHGVRARATRVVRHAHRARHASVSRTVLTSNTPGSSVQK